GGRPAGGGRGAPRAGRPAAARPGVRPGGAAGGRGGGRDGPADAQRGRWVHRIRAAGRYGPARLDPHRPHRPGLHRGDERADGQGHGARAAECVARPIAAAVPSALPERDRRRAPRVTATAVTGHDVEMKRRTVKRYLLAAPALVLLGAAGCKKAESVRPYTTIPVARRDIIVTATASGVIQPILTLSVKSKAS